MNVVDAEAVRSLLNSALHLLALVNVHIKEMNQHAAEVELENTRRELLALLERLEVSNGIFVPSPMQIIELHTWMDIARRKYKKDGGVPIDWTAKSIPKYIASKIKDRLQVSKNMEDVINAFDLRGLG